MVVTDNGSNMVKAVRIAMFDDDAEDDANTDDNVSESNGDDDEDEGDQEQSQAVESGITPHRFPCLPHTLQLVLKDVDSSVVYSKLLTKTKALVKKIRCHRWLLRSL